MVLNRSSSSSSKSQLEPGGDTGGRMPAASTQGVLFVLGLAIAAGAFIGIVLVVNTLIAPKKPNDIKGSAFECGMVQAGDPHIAARLRFSTIAMLFVLFDAEAALLFGVVSVLKGNLAGIAEVGAYVLFLAFGLAYAWRKGALEWRA